MKQFGDAALLPAVMMIMLSLICVAMFLIMLRNSLRLTDTSMQNCERIFSRTVLVIAVWMIALGVAASLGFFADFSSLPPRPAIIVVLPAIALIILSFSKKVTALLKAVPPQWLVYMQAFRIFVEILLWLSFTKNLIPVQMTFEGRNFDIITGLLALPTGYAIAKRNKYSRLIILGFNIAGLILLANILVVAVLSMPTPIRMFMNEPANIIVGYFPFIYLPGVLVVLALALHIFSLRQLSVTSSFAKN